MQVEQQDIETFRGSGYLIIRGLFKDRELVDLIRWTDELEAWPETPGRSICKPGKNSIFIATGWRERWG